MNGAFSSNGLVHVPEEERNVLIERAFRESAGAPEPPSWRSFPIDLLPGPASDYAHACAAAIPTDEAMMGLPILTVLSSAIGSAARIQLKRSWSEPATLWTVAVAPSGSAKSPALHHALRPIYKRERKARERYEREVKEYRQAEERGEDAGEKPARRRYRTGDATVEAVAALHARNPRGLLLARDELSAWIGGFDRYANGEADAQFWIELHSGHPVVTDRKTGAETLSIERPAVPVVGTVQPGKLQDVLTEMHFETGFAARLLLAMPPARPKVWSEADVTTEVQAAYERLVGTLYEVPVGAEVVLSPPAKEVFKRLVNRLGEEVFEMPDGPLRSVAAKAEMHAARLALILHMGRWAAGEVSDRDRMDAETMERAVNLSRWLLRETFRVYQIRGLSRKALSPEEKLLDALPQKFQTMQAVDTGEAQDLSERTVYRYLDKLRSTGAVERPKAGHYCKKGLTGGSPVSPSILDSQ